MSKLNSFQISPIKLCMLLSQRLRKKRNQQIQKWNKRKKKQQMNNQVNNQIKIINKNKNKNHKIKWILKTITDANE